MNAGRRASLTTGIVVLLLAASPAATGDVVQDARRLVDEGRAQDAYARLAPLRATRGGDPEFDFAFALSAVQAGRPAQAVSPLQRILARTPQALVARALLARAYFDAGLYATSRVEFERVAAGPAPPEVRATVSSYLAEIDRRLGVIDAGPQTRPPTRWQAYLEFGGGFDTNANRATADSVVSLPAFGNLAFNIASSGRETGSPVLSARAGGRVSHRLDAELEIFAGARLDVIEYTAERASRVDQDTLDLDLGIARTVGANAVSVAIQSQHFAVDNDLFRRMLGATAQWQGSYWQRTRLSAFAQFADVSYHPRSQQSIRDVTRYLGGVGATHVLAFGPGITVSAGLYAGREDNQHDGARHLGRTLYGVQIGASMPIRDDLAAFAALSAERSEYGGIEPLFLREREDEFVQVSAGITWQFDDHWSVTPMLRLQANDSNIATSDYNSFAATVVVRRDFR